MGMRPSGGKAGQPTFPPAPRHRHAEVVKCFELFLTWKRIVPGIEEVDSGRLEVADIAGGHDQTVRQCGGREQAVDRRHRPAGAAQPRIQHAPCPGDRRVDGKQPGREAAAQFGEPRDQPPPLSPGGSRSMPWRISPNVSTLTKGSSSSTARIVA